jgi:hypothetical protein
MKVNRVHRRCMHQWRQPVEQKGVIWGGLVCWKCGEVKRT